MVKRGGPCQGPGATEGTICGVKEISDRSDWRKGGKFKPEHSGKWCCTKNKCRIALGVIPDPKAPKAEVAPAPAPAASGPLGGLLDAVNTALAGPPAPATAASASAASASSAPHTSMDALRATTTASGVSLLEESGACWLPDVLPAAQLSGYAREAVDAFAELQRAVGRQRAEERQGLPEHLHHLCRMPIQFAEIVERDGCRFDCRHGLSALAQLLEAPSIEGVERLVALLEAVLGPDLVLLAHGQVVALSQQARDACADGGGEAQVWHADGEHLFDNSSLPAHALNVMIPIADVTEICGPTELALGTHLGGKSLPEAQEAGQAPSLVAAEMPGGSALVFDYRLWHRGLPNRQSATDRHMLYLVVAKPWWRDHKNHLHSESIFAAAGQDGSDDADEDGAEEEAAAAPQASHEEAPLHRDKRARTAV